MNKDISVQYAYKKDGKGERHGDEAERMLASQARMHNIVPEVQQMPAQLLLNGNIPNGPAAMGDHSQQMNLGMGMGVGMPPNMPLGFAGGYNGVPPPQQQQRVNAPLPPPPSGLPQRPPPSQSGYGGPQDFHLQGFAPPPGFQQSMPPGFGPPQGQMPPGFMPPPGFQQGQQAGGPPGYGGRR